MRVLSALSVLGLMLVQPAAGVAAEQTAPSGVNQVQPVEVGISVADPKSHGICPRPLEVRAALQINDLQDGQATIRYRFLEDGAPASTWKTISAPGGVVVQLRHRINITEDTGPVRTSRAAVHPAPGRVALGDPAGVRPKSTVSIEVRSGEYLASDTALFSARCVDTGYAALQPADNTDLPDLTATGGVKVGGTFIPWGGAATLSAADALTSGPQGCTFRLAFDVANTGSAPAPAHTARVQRGARTLLVLQTPPLRAERKRALGGQILLPAGQSTLRLRIDDTRLIRETSETNNLASVRITAPALCRGAIPGRP